MDDVSFMTQRPPPEMSSTGPCICISTLSGAPGTSALPDHAPEPPGPTCAEPEPFIVPLMVMNHSPVSAERSGFGPSARQRLASYWRPPKLARATSVRDRHRCVKAAPPSSGPRI